MLEPNGVTLALTLSLDGVNWCSAATWGQPHVMTQLTCTRHGLLMLPEDVVHHSC